MNSQASSYAPTSTLACMAQRAFQRWFKPKPAPLPTLGSTVAVVSNQADGPRHAVLTIDASGSMESGDWPPTRLGAAKEAARVFCHELAAAEPEARVAVVAYGSSAEVACGLTPVKRRRALSRAIGRIGGLGSTNIRDGLQRAHDILKGSSAPCQVVLLTDGHNTHRSPRPIAAKLKKFAVIETVSIGGSPADVDRALLEDLSSEYPDGSKRYRWIGDKERLVKHFRQLAGRIRRA